MLFDVKVLYRGQEQTWTYGTITHAVTDCYGIRRNPKKKERTVTQRDEIFSLAVFLGYNCNLNCTYCYQKSHHNQRNKVVGGIHMIPQFFEKLAKLNLKYVGTVNFWGGEPLVFWKTIVAMIPRFEELYPGVRFSIMTNGTLLDEEKIDFMKAHRFQCNVSCDGFPDERGYDVLTLKQPELLYLQKQLGERTMFQATVGEGRIRIDEALARFRKYMGANVRVSFGHPVRALRGADQSVSQCLTDPKAYADALYKTWLEHPENVIITKTGRLIKHIKYRIHKPPYLGMCGASQGTSLNLGLDGNTYSCHAGSGKPTGTIENYKERSFDEFLPREVLAKHCLNCPVATACNSGCAIVDEEGFKLSCPGQYGLALARYKVAWKELFDVEVIDITLHKETKDE